MFVNLRVLDGSISIHALLAESDHPKTSDHPHNTISIHALLAESDKPPIKAHRQERVFLSTLSLRRATQCRLKLSKCTPYFYPRSPCGERPPTASRRKTTDMNFYPRSPCGERPSSLSISVLLTAFLSTLSLRRATESQPPCARPTTYFYPRSPCGERPF